MKFNNEKFIFNEAILLFTNSKGAQKYEATKCNFENCHIGSLYPLKFDSRFNFMILLNYVLF